MKRGGPKTAVRRVQFTNLGRRKPIDDSPQLVGETDHVDGLSRVLELNLVVARRIFAKGNSTRKKFTGGVTGLFVFLHQRTGVAKGFEH